MANTFIKSEAWENKLQELLVFSENPEMAIVTPQFEGFFHGNSTVHYRRLPRVTALTLPNADAKGIAQSVTMTDETYTLNVIKYYIGQISEIDKIELDVNITPEIITRIHTAFNLEWALEIQSNYGSASYVVTDGDLLTANQTNSGGTNSVKISKDVIYELVTIVNRKMTRGVDTYYSVPRNGRWLILSPEHEAMVDQSPQLVRATALGDDVVKNGYAYKGKMAGVDIYISTATYNASNVEYLMFGQGKPIHFGSNLRPQIDLVSAKSSTDQWVDTIKAITKFDSKVFTEGAEKLGYIKAYHA